MKLLNVSSITIAILISGCTVNMKQTADNTGMPEIKGQKNSFVMSKSTTEGINRPYEVIDGACVYSEAEVFSLSGDPIENAVHKAFEKMDAYGKKTGADALVEYDIDFANRTERDEGRVMLCGTLVKFK